MTPVERMQLKNKVQMVLHAPGGPLADSVHGGPKSGSGSPMLEMTLIFDCSLSKEKAALCTEKLSGEMGYPWKVPGLCV